jgi:hypothetical protein
MTESAGQIAQVTSRLVEGYYAHSAAITVAMHPESARLAPATLPGHIVPIGLVRRKDGTEHAFDFKHFLKLAATNPYITDELPRVWLSGSLLRIGELLSHHRYFDHAPILEFVYHLRNGIAHGNRLRFTPNGLARLNKHPAHNREAYIQGDLKQIFEISPSLAGQCVLFDYLEPGNVLDILLSVEHHLLKLNAWKPEQK